MKEMFIKVLKTQVWVLSNHNKGGCIIESLSTGAKQKEN